MLSAVDNVISVILYYWWLILFFFFFLGEVLLLDDVFSLDPCHLFVSLT